MTNTEIINHYKLIILGSGPAGYTAAIYSARANLNPLLFTGTNKGGQLMLTNEIENWPGDYKKISGYELMNRFYYHSKSLNTKIINNEIIQVNFLTQPFFLKSDSNKCYTADSVIIATGASAKYLGLTSETQFKGKGVSACAICDGYFFKDEDVAVVGGGNTAIEEALYLSNIAKTVHIIHRRKQFRAEQILISRLLNTAYHNVVFHKNFEVSEILGDSIGVTGIIIQSNKNKNLQRTINVKGIFIAIGHEPNTHIFQDQLVMKNNYIVTKSGSMGNCTQTSIKGIFAAGDVIDPIYKQAITSSASGCMAALDAKKYLSIK